MNKKEALKRFDEEIKKREELIQNIQNDKIRLFKVASSNGNTFYWVSYETADKIKRHLKNEFNEIAECYKGENRKRLKNTEIEVELIKEA